MEMVFILRRGLAFAKLVGLWILLTDVRHSPLQLSLTNLGKVSLNGLISFHHVQGFSLRTNDFLYDYSPDANPLQWTVLP